MELLETLIQIMMLILAMPIYSIIFYPRYIVLLEKDTPGNLLFAVSLKSELMEK
jgi:hypothetical protein